jgi:hypothetical protein
VEYFHSTGQGSAPKNIKKHSAISRYTRLRFPEKNTCRKATPKDISFRVHPLVAGKFFEIFSTVTS